jgi:uncharacterized RmlC-like cupin family protein
LVWICLDVSEICNCDGAICTTRCACIRVDAGHAVSAETSVADTAVQTGPVVVAHGIESAAVLIILAYVNLNASPAAECVSSIARAVVGVGASVCAGAQPDSARCSSTVVDIGAFHTIAVEAVRTGFTGKTLRRRRLVGTGDTIEAWVPSTSIRVVAGHTVSTISIIACAAMLTRSIVVAYSIGITGICFRVFTREDLSAGPTTERVSSIARAIKRAGTGVAAKAADSARCSSTVVDIGTVHTIAIEAVRTGVTGKTHSIELIETAIYVLVVVPTSAKVLEESVQVIAEDFPPGVPRP